MALLFCGTFCTFEGSLQLPRHNIYLQHHGATPNKNRVLPQCGDCKLMVGTTQSQFFCKMKVLSETFYEFDDKIFSPVRCTIIGKRRGYNVALSRGRVDDVLVRHIEDCCYYNFCKNVWWFVFSHDDVIYIDGPSLTLALQCSSYWDIDGDSI